MIKDLLYNFAYSVRAMKHIAGGTRLCCNNEHRGEICVLGNGPSLTAHLPSLASAGKPCFAVNDFAVSDAFTKLRPRYYVMVDPYYWDNGVNGIDTQMRENVFRSMNELTEWRMELFVPDYVVKNKTLRGLVDNPNVMIRGFNYTNFRPTRSGFYLGVLKRNFGVVPVGNVLGPAIYISLNLGYDTVMLFGADHSWTKDIRVNEKNEVCTVKRHFFSEQEELEPWRKSNGEMFRMHEILGSLRAHFLGYFFLDWYAKSLGRKIVNCTEGSFIDAFERHTGKE